MATRDVKLEATLLSDSTPLPNKTIHFYHKVAAAPTWISDATDDTDVDGYATITLSLDVPESYDFRAAFEGDADYDASEATQMNFRVKAKTTLTIILTPQ